MRTKFDYKFIDTLNYNSLKYIVPKKVEKNLNYVGNPKLNISNVAVNNSFYSTK